MPEVRENGKGAGATERNRMEVAPAVSWPESSARAVTDMEDIHLLLLFQHAVGHAIDVRLAAEQPMPEVAALRSDGAPIGSFLQTVDFFPGDCDTTGGPPQIRLRECGRRAISDHAWHGA